MEVAEGGKNSAVGDAMELLAKTTIEEKLVEVRNQKQAKSYQKEEKKIQRELLQCLRGWTDDVYQVRHEMNRISEDVKVCLLNPQAGSADFDNLFGKQEIENKPNTPSYTPCYLDKRNRFRSRIKSNPEAETPFLVKSREALRRRIEDRAREARRRKEQMLAEGFEEVSEELVEEEEQEEEEEEEKPEEEPEQPVYNPFKAPLLTSIVSISLARLREMDGNKKSEEEEKKEEKEEEKKESGFSTSCHLEAVPEESEKAESTITASSLPLTGKSSASSRSKTRGPSAKTIVADETTTEIEAKDDPDEESKKMTKGRNVRFKDGLRKINEGATKQRPPPHNCVNGSPGTRTATATTPTTTTTKTTTTTGVGPFAGKSLLERVLAHARETSPAVATTTTTTTAADATKTTNTTTGLPTSTTTTTSDATNKRTQSIPKISLLRQAAFAEPPDDASSRSNGRKQPQPQQRQQQQTNKQWTKLPSSAPSGIGAGRKEGFRTDKREHRGKVVDMNQKIRLFCSEVDRFTGKNPEPILNEFQAKHEGIGGRNSNYMKKAESTASLNSRSAATFLSAFGRKSTDQVNNSNSDVRDDGNGGRGGARGNARGGANGRGGAGGRSGANGDSRAVGGGSGEVGEGKNDSNVSLRASRDSVGKKSNFDAASGWKQAESQVNEERLWEKNSASSTQLRGLMAEKVKQRELALEKTLLAQAKRREEETQVTTKAHQGPPGNSAKRAERRTASGKFQVVFSKMMEERVKEQKGRLAGLKGALAEQDSF